MGFVATRLPVPRTPSRWPFAACVAVVAVAACSAPAASYRREFWQTAPADPMLEVEPAALLPADATSALLDVRGIVVSHHRQALQAGAHELVVAHDDGQHGEVLTLRYALAFERRVPVERGAMVRLVLAQSRSGGEQPVRAMVIQSIGDRRFWGRTVVAALVQTNGLVPPRLLPRALVDIQPTDELVYQSTVRLDGQCVRSAAHREFRVATRGTQDWPTLPGSRMVVPSQADNYEVVLGDNREVLDTDCTDLPPTLWTVSAVVVPPPLGTRTAEPLSRVAPADLDANVLLPEHITPVVAPVAPKKVLPKRR